MSQQCIRTMNKQMQLSAGRQHHSSHAGRDAHFCGNFQVDKMPVEANEPGSQSLEGKDRALRARKTSDLESQASSLIEAGKGCCGCGGDSDDEDERSENKSEENSAVDRQVSKKLTDQILGKEPPTKQRSGSTMSRTSSQLNATVNRCCGGGLADRTDEFVVDETPLPIAPIQVTAPSSGEGLTASAKQPDAPKEGEKPAGEAGAAEKKEGEEEEQAEPRKVNRCCGGGDEDEGEIQRDENGDPIVLQKSGSQKIVDGTKEIGSGIKEGVLAGKDNVANAGGTAVELVREGTEHALEAVQDATGGCCGCCPGPRTQLEGAEFGEEQIPGATAPEGGEAVPGAAGAGSPGDVTVKKEEGTTVVEIQGDPVVSVAVTDTKQPKTPPAAAAEPAKAEPPSAPKDVAPPSPIGFAPPPKKDEEVVMMGSRRVVVSANSVLAKSLQPRHDDTELESEPEAEVVEEEGGTTEDKYESLKRRFPDTEDTVLRRWSSNTGCYLVFDPSTRGYFATVWSTSAVDGAIAFFTVGDNIPLPEAKIAKGERQPVCLTERGAPRRVLKIAFVAFCKLCFRYAGDFVLLPTRTWAMAALGTIEIVWLSGENHLVLCKKGTRPYGCAQAQAVACMDNSFRLQGGRPRQKLKPTWTKQAFATTTRSIANSVYIELDPRTKIAPTPGGGYLSS